MPGARNTERPQGEGPSSRSVKREACHGFSSPLHPDSMTQRQASEVQPTAGSEGRPVYSGTQTLLDDSLTNDLGMQPIQSYASL